jgi:hypothetical protein
MPYIVKSSLGIEPTILPWNEVEKEKLIKEKQEYLKKESKVIVEEKSIIPEEEAEKLEEDKVETIVADEVIIEAEESKTSKKGKKAGDK